MFTNLLTLSRLGFLLVGIWLLFQPGVTAKAIAFALVWVVLLIDAVDGTIARRRGETSALGGVLDIAIDRVVENVYWITFTSLGLVPLWATLLVVARGVLTDAVRGFALAQGQAAFDMMRSPIGRWLVSHRFMRAASGVSKAVMFAGLVAYLGLVELWPGTPAARWLPPLATALDVVVYLTVLINVTRGVPVLVESARLFRQSAPKGA